MTPNRPDAQPAPIPVPAPPPPPAQDGMRRLQIGIAGVLTVLLLVGMAGLIGDRARENAAQGIPATEVKATGGVQQPGNAPLEELGVQPVSDTKAASAAPAPAPAKSAPAPRATVPDLEPDPALERARQSTQ